jgi:hypothetical protein
LGTAFGYTPVFVSNAGLLLAGAAILRRSRISTRQ